MSAVLQKGNSLIVEIVFFTHVLFLKERHVGFCHSMSLVHVNKSRHYIRETVLRFEDGMDTCCQIKHKVTKSKNALNIL